MHVNRTCVWKEPSESRRITKREKAERGHRGGGGGGGHQWDLKPFIFLWHLQRQWASAINTPDTLAHFRHTHMRANRTVWMNFNQDTINNLKGICTDASLPALGYTRTCEQLSVFTSRIANCTVSVSVTPSLTSLSTSKEEMFWSRRRMWAGGNTGFCLKMAWQIGQKENDF